MPLNETDTRSKIIDEKLKQSGWLESYIVREYSITDGRKLIGNKRGKKYKADYILFYKQKILAIIEAKAEDIHPLEGLQQSINYAEILKAQKLHIDYVYTTNGHKIYEHSMTNSNGKFINDFPSPNELFERRYGHLSESTERIITQPYYLEGSMKPRYYQQIAVDKAVEAIANGKKRVLLTLATGTGKTYISFQIVYRLFESKWNIDGSNRRPKILFLADRNVLADQSMNTFNPMDSDCIRINGEEIRRRNGKVPTNANVFFAIYQSIAERKSDECDSENDVLAYYKQYDENFFDLVIIDECHRGSANNDSSWREILNRFKNAVHLGLTATPKRDDNGDTYEYFGEPIYEYSLKEGINDGFLTPYKVKRIQTNIDEYRFDPNDIVIGDLENSIVKMDEFESKVVIPKRTELLAQTILENINPMDKTIVFCVNQQHALDMKTAIDKFKEEKCGVRDNNYCVRVTSNEGQIGRDFLESFQNNDKDIPTILTSSKMLTTGVDAKNVRNIVLTAPIRSMTEFKQIIGRGTRVFEGKDFFTIIDFVGATNLFYDDRWDGEPNVDDKDEDEKKNPKKPTQPKDDKTDISDEVDITDKSDKKEKVTIDIKGKKLKVINIETTYVGDDGIPLRTEEYLELLIGILGRYYDNESQLREIWSNPKNRKDLLSKLKEMNIDDEQLNDLKLIFDSKDSDIYDVLAHLSFNMDIKTQSERVMAVEHSDFIEKYHNQKAKQFLEFILRRYEKDGYRELEEENLGDLIKLSGMGTVRDLAKEFGSREYLTESYFSIQKEIYR